MPLTTWDPGHKAAAIALSGSNLIATSSAGSGTVNAGVYATQAISTTIKQYFEVTVSGTVGQYLSIGVMNGSASLTANIGQTNGAALANEFSGGPPNSTRTYRNAGTPGNLYPKLVSGQVIRVAIDRANNLMWWAVNNNLWMTDQVWIGKGGIAGEVFDPATGTNGLDISIVTGPIYPAMSSAWTGDVATFNGGTSAFAYTPPSGFTALDGGVAAGAGIYGRTFDVIYGRARPMIYNAPTGARTYAVIMGRSFDVIYGRPFPGSL